MTSAERVRSLIKGAVRAPEEELRGATAEDLAALRGRLGRELPSPLAELLRICNGAAIGPGGLFGQRPDQPSLDLPSYLQLFPTWKEQGRLPVAGDGCGNYFVLLRNGQVGFIDTTKDPHVVDRVEASDLWEFVESILVDDQAEQA